MTALVVNALLAAYLVWQVKLIRRYMPDMLEDAAKQRLALEMGVPVTQLYYWLNREQLRKVDAWKESLFANGREHAHLFPAAVR